MCLLPIFQKEWIDVEGSREIKLVIDLLLLKTLFIKNNPFNLEKEGGRRIFNPALLLHAYYFSFFIAIIIDMLDGDLFQCFIKFSVPNIDKEQAEKLIFWLIDLK